MNITVDCDSAISPIYAQSVYQYEKNVSLVLDGTELPANFRAIFSNTRDYGLSVMVKGADGKVNIPDQMFMPGDFVYAWICTGDGNDETLCSVIVPVIRRPVPIPVQTSGEEIPIITNYDLNPEEEDLSFTGYFNNILQNNIEEEP